MINKILFLLGFIAAAFMGVNAAQTPGNIVIQSIETVYKLKANKQGRLESAKIHDREVYKANDYDGVALAYASYGNHITIDKASAPGAKPVYSQVIGEGVFYEDHRVCMMKVDVRRNKPVTVEFERTVKDPAQICEFTFSSLYDVLDYSLVIEVPAVLASSLTFTPVNFPEDADMQRVDNQDGSVRYTYRLHDVKKLEDEDMSPSASLFRPLVRVTGHFADTGELYAYLSSYVTEEQPDDNIKALTAKLTDGLTQDDDKIDAIASWVRQNIRYVAIEHGEYGQRPESAANVLANRYGDCKGSANLIKAMLRAAGLDGRLVWIGTRDRINTDWEQCPTLATGNHMIAACKRDDGIRFIDGTTDYAPARYVSHMLRGQSALIEDGDSYIVMQVPYMPVGTDTDSLIAKYTLDENLVMSGDITHTYSGAFARMHDAYYNSITASKRDKFLHSLAAGSKKSISVNNVDYRRDTPSSAYSYLHASVSDANAVKRSADRLIVSVPVIDPDYSVTFDTTKRVNPIRLQYPCRYVAEIDLVLGDNLAQIDIPADATIDSPWFCGSVKYSIAGNVVHISSELDTADLDVPRERLAEWNSAVRSLRKALNPVIKCRSVSD